MLIKIKWLLVVTFIWFVSFPFDCYGDEEEVEVVKVSNQSSMKKTPPPIIPRKKKQIAENAGIPLPPPLPEKIQQPSKQYDKKVFDQSKLADLPMRRLIMYVDQLNQENPDRENSRSVLAEDCAAMIRLKGCVALVDKNVLRKCLTLPDVDTFSFSGWDMYNIPETCFYLFLPKDYDDKESIRNIKVSIFKDISIFQKVSSPTFEALKGFVETTYKSKPLLSPADFAKIFTTNDVLLKSKEIQELIKSLPEEYEEDYDFVHYYFRPWAIYLTGHGLTNKSIASMDIETFQGLLNSFNKLNVVFMYISSCYAGGENTNYVLNKEKVGVDLYYPLAVGSIMDAIVTSCLDDISTDYLGFFKAVEDTQGKSYSAWLKSVLRHLSLTNNWFCYDYGLTAIPQILMPRIGWFSAIGVDPSLLILHQPAAVIGRKNGFISIKEKLGLVVDPNILYPSLSIESTQPKTKYKIMWLNALQGLPVLQDNLPDEDEYRFYPIFVPRKATVKEETNYFFERIELDPSGTKNNVGLLHFIRNSLLNTQGRESRCCFLIKELEGFNDGIIDSSAQEKIVLTDVVVETVELGAYTPDNKIHAKILFTFKGTQRLMEIEYLKGSVLPGKWDFQPIKSCSLFNDRWKLIQAEIAQETYSEKGSDNNLTEYKDGGDSSYV